MTTATLTEIPGPKGSPLLGNLGAFRRDPLGCLTRWAREYGDVVRLRFGAVPAVLINDPALIEEVLVTQGPAFGRAGAVVRAMRPGAGDGLFTSDGAHWRRQRRMLQPAFQRDQVAGYGATMVELTERMLRSWQDGETRDIRFEMMRLTLAVAAKTLFDADVGDQAGGIGAAVSVGLRETNARLNSLLLLFLPDRFPAPANLRLQRAMRQLDEVVYGIIRERRSGATGADDLLARLLSARDGDGSAMTDRQIRDELVTFMVAGHETTAIALSWTWYLLATHPDAEARLAAEVQCVLGGRPPAVADIAALPFANMVVQEALRLYPPAWAISRDAREDTQLGGHPIARGTSVLMSQWVAHRDPRWFDEPEAFRPERWEDGLAERLPRFAYYPFGGGQRQCIGNTFALQEATLILASIIQRFQLSLAPGADMTPEAGLTLRPRSGVPMLLHRR
jgi:cytochrome P450